MCATTDLELFQWLLQREPPLASLSGQDFQGRTALFSAAVGLGDVENEEEETEEEQARRVCILASAGEASSDRASTIWVTYTTRVTPLHIAGLFWNADAIRVLLDHCGGVDRTAMASLATGRLETVTLLVEADPAAVKVPHPEGPPPDQPLDVDLIDRVLEQVRVNDPAPVDGSTALHYLVRHWDQLDLLRYLVQCGATVNATNHRGKTPLHDVMRGGLFVFDRRGCWRKLEPVDWDRSIQARDAMLGVLIEAGGCMEQRNCAGDTPTQVWDQVTERQRRRLQQRDVARQLLARGRGAGIIGGRDNNLL
ncbi:ankyrin repeat-containing domain protein [Aspergillus flavus]|uniref:Ankyrin repeat-containing domain protein n=1 Tax=Aspergillus flavus (strain ATCC 200026 / FGSC A1120 / IAM 13836 / NRRL 3357 / JCM 12722 / SRRC 167) TaxID=332952 RepID=A0A7U2QU34_ASPFN|nr:ankyrin repeat-containing domain protein [Aspergillus flavus]